MNLFVGAPVLPERAVRRDRDFYETPPWMTRALLRYVAIAPDARVFEPCVGDFSIVKALAHYLHREILTNDINPARSAALVGDASKSSVWEAAVGAGPIDWVITNPAYTAPLPMEILKRGLEHARVGVALMLRISWLEPTKNAKKYPRGPFLSQHPPNKYLVMPRHSFTGNGSSDSATTAWCIWTHEPLPGRPIECCYGAEGW